MLKSLLDSPWTGAVGCLGSIVWEGFWLIGPPLGLVGRENRWYLLWGLIALAVCGAQSFGVLLRENNSLRSKIYDGRPRIALTSCQGWISRSNQAHYAFFSPPFPSLLLANFGFVAFGFSLASIVSPLMLAWFYVFMIFCFPFSLSCWFSIVERGGASVEVKVLRVGDCCGSWFVVVEGTPGTLLLAEW